MIKAKMIPIAIITARIIASSALVLSLRYQQTGYELTQDRSSGVRHDVLREHYGGKSDRSGMM